MADLDRQRKALADELEEAKALAASQEGDNLGEFTSLVNLLDDADYVERAELRKKIPDPLSRTDRQSSRIEHQCSRTSSVLKVCPSPSARGRPSW